MLRYAVSYHREGTKPSANLLYHSSMVPVERSLSFLPRTDRFFLVPLVHEYNRTSLAKYGINCLAGTHRAKAEAIKAGGGGQWKVLIVNAKKLFTQPLEVHTLIICPT